MPVKSGIEALNEIRSFNKSIPVVAVIAFATPSDKMRILSRDFNGYVGKPIIKAELLKVLSDMNQLF